MCVVLQGTPLSELVAFLEKKGLTSSEIDEALKRAESKLEKRESSSGPTSSEREKTEVPQYSQESQREVSRKFFEEEWPKSVFFNFSGIARCHKHHNSITLTALHGLVTSP